MGDAPYFRDPNTGRILTLGFHAREGWFFIRTEDGGVRMFRVPSRRELDHIPQTIADVTLGPDLWASVVAAVSARGETSETYREALAFHEAP